MAVPVTRNKRNRKLPTNWRIKVVGDREYYTYRVPSHMRDQFAGRSEISLGSTLSGAYARFAELFPDDGREVRTMRDLLDTYEREVVPGKAVATQKSNRYSLARLREAFDQNDPALIEAQHIYQYKRATAKKHSEKAYNLDHEVLSHVFTTAIEWGIVSRHPMTGKQVTKFPARKRQVLPIPEEVVAFAARLPRQWQLYFQLKLFHGRRKGELLRLKRTDVLDAGLRYRNNKPPYNEFIVEWEPETRAAVHELLTMRRKISSPYLFHTRTGAPYINEDGETSGFDSMFQRWITKAVTDGLVSLRFTEHDLRKVRASDLDAGQAQALLQHSTPEQTKTYRLKPDVVRFVK